MQIGTLWNERLSVAADMNLDGKVTITDVWMWAKWLYFLPGDLFMLALVETKIGDFFEVSYSSVGRIGSAIWSLILWFIIVGTIASIIEEAK